MSRGPGQLQRRILARLHRVPEGRTLEEHFADHGSYPQSNLRRAILSLQRMGLIILEEGRTLDESYVHLPPPIEPLSNEVVSELLTELRDRS